ncbi:MAG: TrmH family RNA methyltransferase [Verrucomicrobiota bacterium]|jgi:tRNA G18 (ribose-2'-O)-methylase SpoU
MYQVRKVDDVACPELAPYRSMRKMTDQQGQGIFVAEGQKVVTRLLETDFRIHSVLLTEEWLERLGPSLDRRPENIPAFITDKEGISALTGYGCFQAIKAVVSIPDPLELDAWVSQAVSPRFFVAMDGLSSSENVGALVRNAAGFGAQGLVVGPTSCSPYIRRAVHSSMGTIFKLPVHHSGDLAQTLAKLRKQGIQTVAAHPHTNQRTLDQVDFTRDTCVVLGSEGEGLSPEVLDQCEHQVLIPMAHGTDSLNVASAAAVFFYEVFRQRFVG